MKNITINMLIAAIVAIALYFGYVVTVDILEKEEAPAEVILDPALEPTELDPREEAVLEEAEDAVVVPELDVDDVGTSIKED